MYKILKTLFIPELYDIIQSYLMISKKQVRYIYFFVKMEYILLITQFDIPLLPF